MLCVTQYEIPDLKVQQLWFMVMNALSFVGDDDTQLQDVVQSECDMLLSCGFTKPIATWIFLLL